MQVLNVHGKLAHVDCFRIYTLPTGELVMPMGTLRVVMSPEDARAYLEELLKRASRFELRRTSLAKS